MTIKTFCLDSDSIANVNSTPSNSDDGDIDGGSNNIIEENDREPTPDDEPNPDDPDPEFCTDAMINAGMFKEDNGDWCDGYDYCAVEGATLDANGEACPAVPAVPADPVSCTGTCYTTQKYVDGTTLT